jgi:histidyl-tRNA synthetase
VTETNKLIEPRTLKGFRDYLPAAMIPRERLIDTAKRVYRSYGFTPIDTPALEYLEILTGKGSDETDKQLYKFQDPGDRWVGMRFDLTVPLARFAAQHIDELGTPWKRYHIATVWRGENTQRGRFREFMQCDFDTIGTLSPVADVETVLVINDLFAALGFDAFTIRLNNRLLLNGLLEKVGLAEHSVAVLRALDKLAKIGPEKVAAEMATTAAATAEQSAAVLKLAGLEGTNDAVLGEVDALVRGSARGEEGVQKLRDLLAAAAAAGVPDGRIKLDVSIARGLDYYTGTIYETFLDALPTIGSVCSGGRYDNLAGMFTKQQLPGVGASLGLDRLLDAMQSLNLIPAVSTPAPVFIPYFVQGRLHDYLRLAAEVRRAGIGCEVFPEAKKLGKQLQYADRRGFRVALIAGDDELAAGQVQIKDLKSGQSQTVAATGEALVAALESIVHVET